MQTTLLNFNFTVDYIPGKMNKIADTLSRKPVWREETEAEVEEEYTLTKIMAHKLQNSTLF
jgi:hypothetical protein